MAMTARSSKSVAGATGGIAGRCNGETSLLAHARVWLKIRVLENSSTQLVHTPLSHAHFLCVTYSHRVHAWLKVFAVCLPHVPSRLLHAHVLSSSSSFTRPKRSGQAHFRTIAEEVGYLTDPTPQVMSPSSPTRPLLWTVTRRPSTIRTAIASLL